MEIETPSTIDIMDLNMFDMERIIKVLVHQVTNLSVQENGRIKMFIQKLCNAGLKRVSWILEAQRKV